MTACYSSAVRLTMFVAVVGCHPITRSAPLAEGNSEEATVVIDRYYDAIGGHAGLSAIHSRRLRGTYVEGALHATTDIVWTRTPLRRVNVHAPGFDYSEGFDGSVWEYDHLSGRAVHDTGAAEAAGRRGAEFDESFVDAREKGNDVRFIRLDTLGGRSVSVVGVTLRDGWVKQYYFDDTTHLIAALRKAMPIHASGPAVETITVYGDWRRECGVLQPHEFTERRLGGGPVLNTLQWDTIECNMPLTPEELAMPAASPGK